MKILYIVHDNRKGGAAVSFLNMVKGVSKEHEVFVLTPHKKGYIPDELDKLGIWHKNAHYFWWEIAKIGNPVLDRARFGRVTVEAMRASNPVIGSAAGGTTELIEDGVTGFLYEYKDNEALAERMERFIDDPALARVMGQKAYEWAADRFTGEENVAGILAVYEEIIQSHRA